MPAPNRTPRVDIPLANPQVLVTASQGFSPVWSRPQVNNQDLEALMSGLKSLETGLYQAARLDQGQQRQDDELLKARRAQLEGAAAANGDAEAAIWAGRFDNNMLDDPLSEEEVAAGADPNAYRDSLYSAIKTFTDSGGRPEDAIERWLDGFIPANLRQFDPDMSDEQRLTQQLELNSYRKKYLPEALAAGIKWYHNIYVGEQVETRGHYEARFLAHAPVRTEKLAGPTEDGDPLIGRSGLETVGIRKGRGLGGFAAHLREQDPHMARMTNEQVAEIALRGARVAAFENGDFERANLLLAAVKESGLATEARVALYKEVRTKQVDVSTRQTIDQIGSLARSATLVSPDDPAIATFSIAIDSAGDSDALAKRVVDSLKAHDVEMAENGVPHNTRRLTLTNLMNATVPDGQGGRRRLMRPGMRIYDSLALYRNDMEDNARAERTRAAAIREDTKLAMRNLTIEFMRGLKTGTTDKPYVMTQELMKLQADGKTMTTSPVNITSIEQLHDWMSQQYGDEAGEYIDASLAVLTGDRYSELSPVLAARRETYSEHLDRLKYSPAHQTSGERRALLVAIGNDYDNGKLSEAQYTALNKAAEEQAAYGGALEASDLQQGVQAVRLAFGSAAGGRAVTGGPYQRISWSFDPNVDARAPGEAVKLERRVTKSYRQWLVAHVDEQFSKDSQIRETWEAKREEYLAGLIDYSVSYAAWHGIAFAPEAAKRERADNPPAWPADLWKLKDKTQ